MCSKETKINGQVKLNVLYLLHQTVEETVTNSQSYYLTTK